MSDESYYEYESTGSASSSNGVYVSPDTAPSTDAKIFYTGSVNLQTTDFDAAQSALLELVARFGGYIESQEVYHYSSTRDASFTIRIPSGQFSAFLNAVSDSAASTLVYQSVSSTDISEQYFDLERRINTLEIKIQRLNELMAQAEDMEDIITIESALSEAEYQLEDYTGQIRHYDSLLGYSTVYLSLDEVLAVQEGVDDTFGQRLARGFQRGVRGFVEGCGDFVIWVASHILGLLLFAVIVVVVILLISRRKKRKKAKKQEKKPEEKPDEEPLD